ncbi:MAG TPA: winged helix-turn-helix transcriptional regulator [Candidatus Altiarchaeales archaeon]|nr:winged helix-turn-helix transcriptional regulator [Candidatus Altiarchaeales archaeon]
MEYRKLEGEYMKFTGNEKKFMKLILKDGRMSDVEISKKLKITPQAVGKIRKKLEEEGVIKGYYAKLDYRKLGVNAFAIAMFRIHPTSWKDMTEDKIRNRVSGPHIINFYRLSEGEITHVIVYGFRSLDDLDNYFHILQTERGHISELRRLYIFSADSIVKETPTELLAKIIDEMGSEKPPRPNPPS